MDANENIVTNDQAFVCLQCHQQFWVTIGEQAFFADRFGPGSLPRRCKPCRRLRKQLLNESRQDQR